MSVQAPHFVSELHDPFRLRVRERVASWQAASRSPVASTVRGGLLAVSALLAVAGPGNRSTLPYVAVVLTLALAGTQCGDRRSMRLALVLTEALVAAVGAAVVGTASLPLLVNVSAAAVGAGLAAGYAGALGATFAAACVLLLSPVLVETSPVGTTNASVQWILIALVLSLLTGRIHALTAGQPSSEERYVEAHRLLGRLHTVTSGLSGSLDPGTVARELLEACLDVAHCEHGAVLLNVGGDQLVPLALHGYQRVPWRASLTGDGPIQRAWLSGARVLDRRTPDLEGKRAGSALLVLPMTVDGRRVGVVALESRKDEAFVDSTALDDVVGAYALPLRTAALFDELRISAAAEERTRMAREMHDGIAQDLAFLGYEVDGLTAVLKKAGADGAANEARRIREHMTSLISDLRLSMSDLRSSVGPSRGLGAALSEYVRAAGTSSGITVHLSLAEGSTRLRASTEVQLLRIAHEAVNHARRRPDVENLWVNLEVDPPRALLIVEDDGAHVEDPLHDDLRDRAVRIGATFRLDCRQPKGTRMRVFVKG